MTVLTRISLKAMRYFMVFAMACMVLLVFSNVVMRYAFSSSLYIAEGLSSLLFVWMTFVGAALVLYERGLIAVDVLIKRFPQLPKCLCEIFVDLVMLGVAILFLKGSWQQTLLNWNVTSSATLLPASLLYASGIFFSLTSGLMLTLRVLGLIAVITGLKQSSPDSETKIQE